MENPKIIEVAEQHLQSLASLVSAYRRERGDKDGDVVRYVKWIIDSGFSGAFMVVLNEVPIGFMLYSYTISTTYLGSALIIEDVWVNPEFRLTRIGANLVKEGYLLAEKSGASCCIGFVESGNKALEMFYNKLGANKEEISFFRRMPV